VLRQLGPFTTETILSKTYYNVKTHNPESLDWFNVLVAQTISQLRSDAHHNSAVLTSLTTLLNGDRRPDFLGEIKVTELSLGEDYPIFSNCRIVPIEPEGGTGTSNDGRLQARMDVDLSDFITLGVETKVILNYPKPLVAVLPVALAVSVVRFSGTFSISFNPSDPPAPGPTSLSFSFMDDYRLDLSVRSLLGSRARLQDVPKLAQLVESQLHKWFNERCVSPRFQEVFLPNLWPRMQNVRGGDENDDGMGVDILPHEDISSADEMRRGTEATATANDRDHTDGVRQRRPPLSQVNIDRVSQLPGAMPGAVH
jgi:maintenance of morphology protein 1